MAEGLRRLPWAAVAAPHSTNEGAMNRLEAALYMHTRCRMGSVLSLAGAVPRNPKTLQHAPEFLPLQMRIQPG